MTILTVGPGGYSTIAAAVAASQDGDILQVQAGTYTNDFAEITHKITIEGVGGMANLVATEQIPNGKAILITDTDVTIDHLGFFGATVADKNGAGIRYQGGNLTVTNSYFYANQNGILGADDPSGIISIQNSEFDHNGTFPGFTHGIYIGKVAQLTVDNSYFYGTQYGHAIKSRAAETTITNSRIVDTPDGGKTSNEIDLPNGGVGMITNNTIEKGTNAQNPFMVSFGEEGNLYPNSSLSVVDNTLINHKGGGSAVGVKNATDLDVTVSGNSYYGLSQSNLLQGNGVSAGNTALQSDPGFSTESPIQGGNPNSDGGGGMGTPPDVVEPASVSLFALGAALSIACNTRNRRRAARAALAAT